jgi:hypothetical protein
VTTESKRAEIGIRNRIRDLTRGPTRMEFRLFHDKERDIWLGEIDTRLIDDLVYVAAEGATPSEVLRKLAEMME